MKKLLFLAAALSVAAFVFSQDRKLAVDDLLNSSLGPRSSLTYLQWVGNSGYVAYLQDSKMVISDGKQVQQTITLDQMSLMLAQSGLDMLGIDSVELWRIPRFTFVNDSVFEFWAEGNLMACNIKRGYM